ncbi:MAG TPA: glycosyltransferase [Acidimicrobiales bacterium]|nr:glycosyltransferase [Acidimicrobiales bacterium]
MGSPESEPAPVVTVQVVLFEQSVHAVHRLVDAVAAAARQVDGPVALVLGDCTAQPVLDGDASSELAAAARGDGLAWLRYEWFGANLGHGQGQHRLLASHGAPVVVLCNPDALPGPRSLARLVAALDEPTVGAAEARQLPLESPKLAAAGTGAAPWAAGCLLAVRRAAYEQVGGFDPAFFLHDDDVDLCWRLRRAGWQITYVPAAVGVHHREVDPSGYAASQATEAVMMRVGELLLAGRAGRPDVAEAILAGAAVADGPDAAAAQEYGRLVAEARLPRRFSGASAPGVLLDRVLRRF